MVIQWDRNSTNDTLEWNYCGFASTPDLKFKQNGDLKQIKARVGPGGGTDIFGRTGMCCSNGSLFYKKSLNMGPVFCQKILKHGSTFLTEPKFSGFRMSKNPENSEIFEKWAYFWRKILKNGYPFLPKSPLKMGRSFEARAAHPCPTQTWVPPRVGASLFSNKRYSRLL